MNKIQYLIKLNDGKFGIGEELSRGNYSIWINGQYFLIRQWEIVFIKEIERIIEQFLEIPDSI